MGVPWSSIFLFFLDGDELLGDLGGFGSGDGADKRFRYGFVGGMVVRGGIYGVEASGCFPFDLAIFLEPLEILGDSQFAIVEGLFDFFKARVELIEEILEFVDVHFL